MKLKANNLLLHENWEFYGEEDPPILKTQIPYEQTKNLLRNAYNAYYLRPKYLWMQFTEFIHFPSLRRAQRLFQGFLAFLPSH